MGGAASEYEQMPEAVPMSNAAIKREENNPHRVEHAASGEPGKAGWAERPL